MTSMKPIDDAPMPPQAEGLDHDTLTQDIVGMIDGAVRDWIDRVVLERGVGRRRAALVVIQAIRFRLREGTL